MKKQKYILAVAGVISAVLGVVGAVPSFLRENLTAAVLSVLLLVFGLVLLAWAFGD